MNKLHDSALMRRNHRQESLVEEHEPVRDLSQLPMRQLNLLLVFRKHALSLQLAFNIVDPALKVRKLNVALHQVVCVLVCELLGHVFRSIENLFQLFDNRSRLLKLVDDIFEFFACFLTFDDEAPDFEANVDCGAASSKYDRNGYGLHGGS